MLRTVHIINLDNN
jgi:hypothetical protein